MNKGPSEEALNKWENEMKAHWHELREMLGHEAFRKGVQAEEERHGRLFNEMKSRFKNECKQWLDKQAAIEKDEGAQ